ncbi:MAG: exopolysaccharide biosynthesis polyprenyl glycosylphosphotransferase [Solirubrobacterales bacterium]|nr:exopolysaccharide biosynthesis polyprenyl glycosylphosphotransferase [Solirubrobacterales bacterium]
MTVLAPPEVKTEPRRGRSIAERTRVRDAVLRRSLAGSDAIAVLLALVMVTALVDETTLVWPALLASPAAVLVGKIAGLYDHDALRLRRSSLDEVPILVTLTALLTLVVWLAGPGLTTAELTRWQVVGLWGGLVVFLGSGRFLVRALVRSTRAVERCILIGSLDARRRIEQSMSLRRDLELVDHFPMRGREGGRFSPMGAALRSAEPRLRRIAEEERIDRVILTISGIDEFDENLLDGIFALEQLGVKVSVVPQMLEVIGSAGELEDFDGLPVLGIRPFGLSRSSKLIKRGFDLAVAGTLVLLLSPVLAVLALLVRRSSPGPILYRQTRIGLEGEPFEMLKFRTMVDGAEAMQSEFVEQNATDGIFKIIDDPRATPLGRHLRRTSLDELPQLFCVLHGAMSLVGPRPLVPGEDAAVEAWRRRRLDVRPGMTGPWQVLVSTRLPLDEMVKMDYLYIATWSPWSDFLALVRTVPHVLGRRGL